VSGWRSCFTMCFQMPFEENRRDGGQARRYLSPVARQPGKFLRRVAAAGRQSAAPNIRSSPKRFITACANGDLQALTACWIDRMGRGTILGDFAPPPQIITAPDEVGTEPASLTWARPPRWSPDRSEKPVLLAFAERRLFAGAGADGGVTTVLKIEATVDPSAAISSGET